MPLVKWQPCERVVECLHSLRHIVEVGGRDHPFWIGKRPLPADEGLQQGCTLVRARKLRSRLEAPDPRNPSIRLQLLHIDVHWYKPTRRCHPTALFVDRRQDGRSGSPLNWCYEHTAPDCSDIPGCCVNGELRRTRACRASSRRNRDNSRSRGRTNSRSRSRSRSRNRGISSSSYTRSSSNTSSCTSHCDTRYAGTDHDCN